MADPRLLVVLGAIAGAAWLQGDLGEANAERRQNDFRYTPDRDVARVLSMGHRSTMADSLWLRALPDFARQFDDKGRIMSRISELCTKFAPFPNADYRLKHMK